MFHGGTNFGFMNGGNVLDVWPHYANTITSYDYDAPLTGNGLKSGSWVTLIPSNGRVSHNLGTTFLPTSVQSPATTRRSTIRRRR